MSSTRTPHSTSIRHLPSLLAVLLAAGGSEAVSGAAGSSGPANQQAVETRPGTTLPPIATSRFAVPESSFRELRGLGLPAPPPIPGDTLHGEPLESWTPGQVTLLLFWSPFVGGNEVHLAQLAEVDRAHDHIEVASIGLGPRDRVSGLLDGIRGKDRVVPRTVVDGSGRWREAFLAPLGLTQLPAIVAIDENGAVLHHGPVAQSTIPLGQIVARTFDPAVYRANALEYGARQNALRIIARDRGLARRGEISWDGVLDTIREAIELDPTNTVLRVQEFDTLLMGADRPDEAYEVGRRVLEEFPTSPITLNDLAWHVVSFPDVSRRDLDFALEAATRANAIQGWLDSSMLDTLARVHWMRGEASEAVRVQRVAVGLAPDSWYGDATRANLVSYTDGTLEPGALPPPYRSPRQPR